MINFLKEVANVFNVGPDGTHIAVIAYSSDAKLEFTFNTLSGAQITAEEYGNLIDKIEFQRGFTYIDKALIMADEQVFTTSAGMRPGVSQVRNCTPMFYSLNIAAALSNWFKLDSAEKKTGVLRPVNHIFQYRLSPSGTVLLQLHRFGIVSNLRETLSLHIGSISQYTGRNVLTYKSQ